MTLTPSNGYTAINTIQPGQREENSRAY